MEDLGEDALPEPASFASGKAEDAKKDETVPREPPAVGSVPLPNDPAVSPEPAPEPVPESPSTSSASTNAPSTSTSTDQDPTPAPQPTTAPRAPMHIPSTVHVHITTENLKDYVGPPVYHQDRLYSKPPPAGVSTGLGYLGNGSGAVMPIEAMVRLVFLLVDSQLTVSTNRACRARAPCS